MGGDNAMDRREFLALGGAALTAAQVPHLQTPPTPGATSAPATAQRVVRPNPTALHTNVAVALRQPKTPLSMPGPYPGVVAEAYLPGSMKNMQPVPGAAERMVEAALLTLTGDKDVRDAWRRFVSPGERVGIKFNPVGHQICGVTRELISAVVAGIEKSGIPRKDMLVWHRFDDEHARTYKPEEVHPGVQAYLLNWFIVKDGRNTPGGFERWDQSAFYEADFELPDADNMLEEMFHGGPRSYFPKILTQGGKEGGVDKVINIPVLKHHGISVITGALKNLAYGATTNCPRGHYFIHRYVPEVCAFPPLRDKVVLNIMDGFRVQYDRGPSPAAQFIVPHDRIYAATDPVALDSVGFDVILAQQVASGRLKPDQIPGLRQRHYGLAVAENLGLGIHQGRAIDSRKVTLA
ncbi:MAG: DUF362 domain-containing protein [Acidobacteria bacterium]|nr:DUF362 domain-containing protein [Acidobacteriota bacterium]